MFETIIVIRYETINDELVMERVRAFLDHLKDDGVIDNVNHEDITTTGI